MSRHCVEHGVDHCFAINLNELTFGIGWHANKSRSFKLSGVLYYPHIRFAPYRWVEKVEWCRKEIQLRWMLCNRNVATIFLLNDPAAARLLNRRSSRDIFRSLPDPAVKPSRLRAPRAKTLASYGVDQERTVFLVFGSMSRRKGVTQALEAVRRLEPDVAAQVALLFVGTIQRGLKEEIEQLARTVKTEQPGLSVRIEDRFVETERMWDLFAAADFVLLPYQRGEASSGVLGHAAAAGKPVLGPEMGLLGRLITKYGLGMTVDTRSAAKIAVGFTSLVRNRSSRRVGLFDERSAAEFVAERAPQNFTRMVAEATTHCHGL